MIPYVQHAITPEDEAAVLRVLRSPWLTQGPEVERFEDELAAFAGAKYAVAVNSGTAALHLAYEACGDILHVPAMSFVATANALLHTSCHHGSPRFYDWYSIRARQEGCVVVTLGGEPVPDTEHPCRWIVDACHGPIHLPAGYRAACLSFHPAKHVAAGEGGAILTNDDAIARTCRLLRSHGRALSVAPMADALETAIPLLQRLAAGSAISAGEEQNAVAQLSLAETRKMVALGFNYRMPELSAALARSQLSRVMEGVQKRRTIAAIYDAAFAGVVEIEPRSPESWLHLYRLRHPQRDAFRQRLAARGVGTAVHYPVIPLQSYYRERFGYEPGMWPNAEKYAAETVSIPMFPTLTDAEIQTVISAVKESV